MPTSPQIDPIHIFYPNGGTSAVQMYVWDGVKPVLWDGQVSFSGTISIGSVSGTLSNNNAAPAANNLGALVAVANSSSPSYTEGRQVLLSTDLNGNLRVLASVSTTGLATSSNQTDGSQKTQVVNTTGNTQAFNTGNAGTTTPRVVLASDQPAITVSITTGSAVIGKLVSSTPYSTTSTNTAVTVTTSAAIITAYYIGNSSTTTAAYLQLFNATAGAVTLGSTTPTQSFYIPAGSAANVAGLRKSFGTAFAIAATSGRANSTAPALALDVNFDYE